MRVYQFGEFLKDLHNLIGTLTTSGDNHNISFCLLAYPVLQDRLTRTERTGDKTRTALYYWVQGINYTDARL